MSTTLRSVTPQFLRIKPRSNPPMRLSQTSIRLTRNSEKFISNSSKCKFTNLPAEPICDLVSNQQCLISVAQVIHVFSFVNFCGGAVKYHKIRDNM